LTNISSVYLDFEEAHLLANLEGFKQDLEWVSSAGAAYNDVSRDFNTILMEAVCSAILIKYGRVFSGGIRGRLPKEFTDSMNEDQAKSHQYFLDVRDKFIAHSVNDFEENYPAAYFENLESENPEFDQVHVQHTRTIALGKDDIEAIILLAKYFLEKVNHQMKIQKECVEKVARKIPLEELKKIKPKLNTSSKDSAGSRRIKKYTT
jgi:hypothetical protein